MMVSSLLHVLKNGTSSLLHVWKNGTSMRRRMKEGRNEALAGRAHAKTTGIRIDGMKRAGDR
jgi:hypothetical protein